jgi:amidase
MSANGCLSRTVLDTALFLDVTSGGSREAGAPPPPDRPFVEYARTPPGRLRIAFTTKAARTLAGSFVGEEARGAVGATAELLRSLGHEVAERTPRYGLVGNAFTDRYLRGIHDDVTLVPDPEGLERRTRNFGRLGGMVPRFVVERDRRREPRDRERIGRVFEEFDVLMTPVMGGPAVEVGRWDGRGALRTLLGMSRFYSFTALWNHLGQPAASLPAGFSREGLPLAVQLVGRFGEEGTLLSLAAQLEAERPWAEPRPPLS